MCIISKEKRADVFVCVTMDLDEKFFKDTGYMKASQTLHLCSL